MANAPADPRYPQYNNDQLAALLARSDIDANEKQRMREELTRRMRDDLLRSSLRVDRIRKQERRGRTWRKGKLILVLLLALLCFSAICLLLLFQPEILDNLRNTLPSQLQFLDLPWLAIGLFVING